jgi:hypothetical protein
VQRPLPSPVNRLDAGLRNDVLAAFNRFLPLWLRTQGSPGINVAVATQDGIVSTHSLGSADLFSQRPSRPTDIYPLASLTKPLTASMAQILASSWVEGRLGHRPHRTFQVYGLNTPLVAYVNPGGTIREDLRPQGLTLSDLLSHRSGATMHNTWQPDLSDPYSTLDQPDLPLDELVNRGRSQWSPPHVPRQGFAYSNQGFLQATAVLERATGKTYAELFEQLITRVVRNYYAQIAPTGLEAFHLEGRFPRAGTIIDRIVRGHMRESLADPFLPMLPFRFDGHGGAFGAHGSMTAMALVGANLLYDERHPHPLNREPPLDTAYRGWLMPRSQFREMISVDDRHARWHGDGSTVGDRSGYGLGFEIHEIGSLFVAGILATRSNRAPIFGLFRESSASPRQSTRGTRTSQKSPWRSLLSPKSP